MPDGEITRPESRAAGSSSMVPRSSTELGPGLEQMKRCLEVAGSSLERVVKCNVYVTDPSRFGTFNEIYARYFPVESPARIFLCVPCFPGPLDIEIDCVAVI